MADAKPKPSLAEMAEAVQDAADHQRSILKHYYEFFPDAGPDVSRERVVAALDAAAHLLRILGTFADDSRRFVAGLLKKHAG